jgi:hypothetical protein
VTKFPDVFVFLIHPGASPVPEDWVPAEGQGFAQGLQTTMFQTGIEDWVSQISLVENEP